MPTHGPQPITVVTIPMPSGAASAAKQAAPGTAGTPSADVVSIQGVAGGTPQPVSLATLPALPAGAAVIGHVIVDSAPSTPVTGTFFQATQPVSLATLPALVAGAAVIGHVISDTGSTTAVTGNVAVTNAGLTNLDVALSTRTKPADQQHAIIDSGTTAVTQATGTNLHTVVDSGTITTVSTVSAARIVGNAGATMDAAIGGAAPTNAQWHTNAPSTASAAACSAGNAAALTVLNIKASAGNVYGVTVVNKTASVIYLQFYNTAGVPVLGTSVISWIPIAASGVLVIPPGTHALSSFATGIGIGASTTPTSTGTPATAPDVTVWFK